MTIDISMYVENKKHVINYFNNKGNRDIPNTISMMSSVLFVPCVAVAYWLGEETNWHPDSISAIQRLVKFYGYTKIEGKPVNSPI